MSAIAAFSAVELEPCHIAQARVLWEQLEGVGLSSAGQPHALSAFLLAFDRSYQL